MKTTFIAAVVLTFAATQAQSGTIDFTDSQFNSTFVLGTFTTSVVFDGITFDVTAVARGADGFRKVSGGQSFAVSGNGLFSLTFSTTQDIVFTSLIGQDRSILDADTSELPFELLVNGAAVETGHQFTSAWSTWDFNDINLSAGSQFRIREIGTGDPNSRAVLNALNFELAHATVPAPAGLPLVLSGLCALAFARKSRRFRN